jgi:hypothetical protein
LFLFWAVLFACNDNIGYYVQCNLLKRVWIDHTQTIKTNQTSTIIY